MKAPTIRQFATLSLTAALVVALAAPVMAQGQKPLASPAAKVSQSIGVGTEITVSYHRPGVRGRNVWEDKSDNPNIGPLVPRDGDPRPWRAGANNTTQISFSQDVKIEGNELPAGDYGLFMIPRDDKWTVIFSRDAKGWGSFRYNEENDALRIDVKPVEAPHQEWLLYGFEELEDWACTAFLHWERVKIPFRIEAVQTEE